MTELVGGGELDEPLNPVPEEPAGRVVTEEDVRLGGLPPLKTIAFLSVGPVIAQLSNAFFAILSTFWVSKAVGDDGLSAMSTYNAFDGIGRAFGFFIAVAASMQVAALFGEGNRVEAGQVCADLIRFSGVFGVGVPALLIPLLKPSARWFGAADHIVDIGFDYICPMTACTLTTCLYCLTTGFLQGEGRTFFSGLVNIGCLVINIVILDPIFLFAMKMGMLGVGVATVISEVVPAVILLVMYYKGKFGVKPAVGQLLRKFSPHTIPALKVGTSQLIANLSGYVPSIAVRKYIGMATGDDFDNAMAGFNTCIRFNTVTVAFFQGISMGFIPAASYAYAAHRYRRFIWLIVHATWICAVWGAITSIITLSIPREISKLFSDSEGYLNQAERMVRYVNSAALIGGFRLMYQAILQAMQLGNRATLLSVTGNFVVLFAFTLLL
jgi:Na+-driven multidrug efflux pump